MLLSSPPGYNFFNVGSLFFLFAILLIIGMVFLAIFNNKKKKKEPFNINSSNNRMNIILSSSFIYPAGVIVVVALFISGMSMNLEYSENKFINTLNTELTYQTKKVYNVDFTPDTLNMLTEISSSVVGSEILSTTITTPFTDEDNPGRLFKFQVSNTGIAKLLQSDFDFKEISPEPEIVDEEIFDNLDELESDKIEID